MRVLVFDLTGSLAHFRKIYTNSSSLSYSLPPRTCLAGIIAAMLGRERDSYYQEFNLEHSFIAVRKLGKTRKIMQTLNYMRATGNRELMVAREHTQIPFELVCGDPELHYRVYFAGNPGTYEELKQRLIKDKYVFPPYLGAAPFSATVSFVAEASCQRLQAQGMLEVATPINSRNIVKFFFDRMQDNVALVKERMPVDFTAERYPVASASYIYDENASVLPVSINENMCWRVAYKWEEQEIEENIIFY
jgi:CRISPR-associated protein Cas5h